MYRENAFFLNAILTLFAFNFVVHVYTNRQLFGIEILSLLITIKLIRQYGITNRQKYLGGIFLAVCAICVTVTNVIKLIEEKQIYVFYMESTLIVF